MLFINALSKRISVIKKVVSVNSEKTRRIDMQARGKAYYENLEEEDLRNCIFYPLNDLIDSIEVVFGDKSEN